MPPSFCSFLWRLNVTEVAVAEISILLGPMVRITVDAMIFIPRPKLLERPFSSRCQRWQAPHGRALSGLMFFLP
jgi:hypothetical protein